MRFGLMARMAAFNLAGLAGVLYAGREGWLHRIVEGDSSGLSVGIAALFLVGLLMALYRGIQFSVRLCVLETPEQIKERGLAELRPIRQIAKNLVLLGLIGTVLGFIQALSGVDAAAAGDVHAVQGMVGALIEGMGIALYTTLVGSVLNLWLGTNHDMLLGALSRQVLREGRRGL